MSDGRPPSRAALAGSLDTDRQDAVARCVHIHIVRHDERHTTTCDDRIGVGEIENGATAVVPTFRQKEFPIVSAFSDAELANTLANAADRWPGAIERLSC